MTKRSSVGPSPAAAAIRRCDAGATRSPFAKCASLSARRTSGASPRATSE